MQTTVIIPTYNYGRFLREAIASVQSQTVQDFEIIVVDDGSIDETPDVLRTIVEPRLRVFRTENRGISAARNTGLEHARGVYIAFLDADDRWRADKLRLQLEVMDAEPDLGAVFTNFVRFDAEHVYPRDQFSFFPELSHVATAPARAGHGRRVLTNAFETFVVFGEFPTWVQTILFRATTIVGLRFPDGRRGSTGRLDVFEDAYFCLRVYERAPVAYLDVPLVEVRRHGTNVTRDLDILPRGRLAMLQLLEKDTRASGSRRALTKRLSRQWVNVGRHELSRGRIGRSLAALMHGLRYPGYRYAALKSLLLFPVQAPIALFTAKRRRD